MALFDLLQKYTLPSKIEIMLRHISEEVIAKLLCLEKSMILRSFASDSQRLSRFI